MERHTAAIPETQLARPAPHVMRAAGLHRRAPWAGNLAALTLLAIWPANIQMALEAGKHKGPGAALMNNKALMWGRVPLQLPLIWAALQARPAA